MALIVLRPPRVSVADLLLFILLCELDYIDGTVRSLYLYMFFILHSFFCSAAAPVNELLAAAFSGAAFSELLATAQRRTTLGVVGENATASHDSDHSKSAADDDESDDDMEAEGDAAYVALPATSSSRGRKKSSVLAMASGIERGAFAGNALAAASVKGARARLSSVSGLSLAASPRPRAGTEGTSPLQRSPSRLRDAAKKRGPRTPRSVPKRRAAQLLPKAASAPDMPTDPARHSSRRSSLSPAVAAAARRSNVRGVGGCLPDGGLAPPPGIPMSRRAASARAVSAAAERAAAAQSAVANTDHLLDGAENDEEATSRSDSGGDLFSEDEDPLSPLTPQRRFTAIMRREADKEEESEDFDDLYQEGGERHRRNTSASDRVSEIGSDFSGAASDSSGSRKPSMSLPAGTGGDAVRAQIAGQLDGREQTQNARLPPRPRSSGGSRALSRQPSVSAPLLHVAGAWGAPVTAIAGEAADVPDNVAAGMQTAWAAEVDVAERALNAASRSGGGAPPSLLRGWLFKPDFSRTEFSAEPTAALDGGGDAAPSADVYKAMKPKGGKTKKKGLKGLLKGAKKEKKKKQDKDKGKSNKGASSVPSELPRGAEALCKLLSQKRVQRRYFALTAGWGELSYFKSEGCSVDGYCGAGICVFHWIV